MRLMKNICIEVFFCYHLLSFFFVYLCFGVPVVFSFVVISLLYWFFFTFAVLVQKKNKIMVYRYILLSSTIQNIEHTFQNDFGH